MSPFGTERLPQRRRRVERRPALLEHHHPQPVGPRDRAGVGGDLAGEHAQQRALAAAVGAEQAELRARRQRQVEAGEQRPAAERLGDARRR